MKNIKYNLIYILFILIIPGMWSCNKLEEYNPSNATAENVWNTPSGFQTLINASYIGQRYFLGKEDGALMTEAGTDLWYAYQKGNYASQLFKYTNFTSSSSGTSTNYWRDLWPGINFCNAGIERINNAGYQSQAVRKQKEGELRYLRAFYYYHIVETWGGVCLRTAETTSPILTAQRSSVKDFYNLMISDLDSAKLWLPTTTSDLGRAVRKSAYGLLAKVLLTRAYYSLDEGNTAEANDYFTRAKKVAHTVIDSAANWGVSLYPNYSDLWLNDNSAISGNKHCKEALYVVSNSMNLSIDVDGNGNRLHLWFLCNYNGKPGMVTDMANGYPKSMYFMPTEFLLDLFDGSKDSRYAASFQDTWKNNSSTYTWTAATCKTWGKLPSVAGQKINVGDTAIYITNKSIADKRTRKYVVIDRDSLYAADSIRSTCDLFPALKKFLDPTRTSATAQPGTRDIIMIRLAEMYMIAAEAEFQLGDKASAAIDINVIRNRASKTHSGDLNVSASDITLDFILDERAREFAGEHMRWFDLKRTRTLAQRIQKYNKNIHLPDNLLQKGNGHFENVLLRPVPQTELDALSNGIEFGQNPGY
ncbi:MAG: RagB/SusD family nutrient uptake outer membrane protein [Bacteroidota bacterium]|nr:RagB/SusD family nutrient uptake outer membrane protein [Bacteroidota bacterium]